MAVIQVLGMCVLRLRMHNMPYAHTVFENSMCKVERVVLKQASKGVTATLI